MIGLISAKIDPIKYFLKFECLGMKKGKNEPIGIIIFPKLREIQPKLLIL